MSITRSMSDIELADPLTLSELPTAWLHLLSTTLTPESAARIRTTCKLLQKVRAWKCCCSTAVQQFGLRCSVVVPYDIYRAACSMFVFIQLCASRHTAVLGWVYQSKAEQQLAPRAALLLRFYTCKEW
jgi:hypothetical protein